MLVRVPKKQSMFRISQVRMAKTGSGFTLSCTKTLMGRAVGLFEFKNESEVSRTRLPRQGRWVWDSTLAMKASTSETWFTWPPPLPSHR